MPALPRLHTEDCLRLAGAFFVMVFVMPFAMSLPCLFAMFEHRP
jgi:hypothetical protein